jgi:hypothetical protein
MATPDTTPESAGAVGWLVKNRVLSAAVLLVVAAILAALDGWLFYKYRTEYLIEGVLIGTLAVAFGLIGLFQRMATPDSANEVERARGLLLSLGLAAGLAITLIGLTLEIRWYDYLQDWLKFGKREHAGQVLFAFVAMVAGLGVMFASLQVARSEERKSLFLRRLVYGYNAVLTGILVLLILVVVNVLVYLKLPGVIDCTQSNIFSLSDRSARILEGLNKPAKVYLLMSTDDRIYDEMRTLLSNAQDHDPKLQVEQLSPTLSTPAIKELVKKYPQIDSEGVLIVYGEGKDENASFIRRDDLVSRDFNPMTRSSGEMKFQGEAKLMTELSFLSESKQRPVVYFTQSAGELDLNDRQRGSENGLGTLQDRLGKRNFDARALKFDPSDPKVPDDATIVVVPGPRQPWSQPNAAALKNFVEQRGGKLVALIDVPTDRRATAMPDTGLEGVLGDLGVEVTKERLLSVPVQLGGGTINNPEIALLSVNRALASQNAVAKAFEDAVFGFNACRVVRPSPNPPRNPMLRAEPFLTTLEGLPVWTEKDLQASPSQMLSAMRSDPKLRREKLDHEPLPVAVVVTEQAMPTGMGHPPTAGKPKAVAVGDASFVSNKYVDEQSSDPSFDLFVGLLDWLRERPTNIGIEPRTYQMYTLDRGTDQARLLLLDPALIVLGIVGLGTGVWVVRRR